MYEQTRKYLAENEGNSIKLRGKISNTMWQHIQIHLETHPNMNYFDLEDGFQIIIYSQDPISCKDKMEIEGKVIKVEGVKNSRSKANGFSEYHLVVDSWKKI